MRYSIVIPTYNEEKDILYTLKAIENLTYKDKEVIIVDGASEDRTVDIIKSFIKNKRGYKLIANKKNRGLSLDRNQGILQASGEIVIILNADVILPPDFIERIDKHYRSGFDVVLVESEVANQNKLFPRWIECLHHKMYDKRDDLVWTEGFSCRKELAIKAGLFPYVNRNSAGEDAIFGENLEKIGAKKIIDRTIRVRHYAPEDIKTFWNQRKGRSRGTIFVMKFYFKQKNAKILLTAFPRLLFNLIYSLTLIMPLLEAFVLAKYSFRKYRDILPFFLVNQINSFASFFGKIEALWLILNADS